MLKFCVRLIAFVLTVWCWLTVLDARLSPAWSVAIMWGGVALVPVAALAGRRVLDRRPQWDRDGWTTAALHYMVMILLGCAAMVAIRFGKDHPILSIPLSRQISGPVTMALAVLAFGAVVNLAIQGLGAPFAVALSRRIAKGWLYARTRNPMVLGTLLFTVALGFYLQSLQVVLWAAAWASPALLLMVRVYEERELEMRFGAPYLEYKRRTPFLFPRLRRAGTRARPQTRASYGGRTAPQS
ncbi:MAG TPA: hypothetical protein VMI94_15555 [Bryobacteraceae bacterium]|nr:hypothetical protein [Bryobacteraceae bacterium]